MRKLKGEKINGERIADERGVVRGTLRMAVVAKPATKSVDSSASVN